MRGPELPYGVLTMMSIRPSRIRSSDGLVAGGALEVLAHHRGRDAVAAQHVRGPAGGQHLEPEVGQAPHREHHGPLVAVGDRDEHPPDVGSDPYEAACDFANAGPNDASMPITSPVDFISGPEQRVDALPPGVRNRLNGSTASLTAIGASAGSSPPSPSAGSRPSARSSAIVAPSMIRAAALASGTAVALETNGTVREARGLASST